MKKIIAISCAAAFMAGCGTVNTAPKFKSISVQAVSADSSQSLKIADDAVKLLKTKYSLDTELEFKPVGGFGQVLAYKLQEAGYRVSPRGERGSIFVSYTLDSLDSMKLFMLRAGDYQLNRVYKSSSNGLALVSSSVRSAESKIAFLSDSAIKKTKKPIKASKIKFKGRSVKTAKRSLLVESMTNDIQVLEKELLSLKKVKKVAVRPKKNIVRTPVRSAKAPARQARNKVRTPIRLVSNRTSVMPPKQVIDVQSLIAPLDVQSLLSPRQFAFLKAEATTMSLPSNVGMKPQASKKYYLQVLASRDRQLLLKNQRGVSEKGYQSKIVTMSNGMGVLRIYSNSRSELAKTKQSLLKSYNDSYIKKVVINA